MIACTFPGKLGDCLYSLPTVKKLAEAYKTKVDFYTSKYCAGLERLFEYQPYINEFIVMPDYVIQRYDMGIQPWYMNVSPNGYDCVVQLGFRSVPDRPLPIFIANQVGLTVDRIEYAYPEIETLDEPYVVMTPHNDVRYKKIFLDFIDRSPYPTVILGSKDEYFGKGIDKTGLDFLEVLPWIAHSIGFIGMSANFVLAEGFRIPKIVPHDGHSFDMRHLLYDSTHFYPVNPKVETLLGILKLMNTFSKTLNTNDYELLGGYGQHISNIVGVLEAGRAPARFEHPHRKWEYALAYKVLDEAKAIRVLDVGGGGSVFAPAMAWLKRSVLQVDPGDVGAWIKQQERSITRELPFEQKNFMEWNSEEKFDAVVCLSVIEHVIGDQEFFLKLLDYVKVGGVLFLTTDFHPSGMAVVSGHVRTYNKEGLLRLASLASEKGFEVFGDDPDYDYFQANVNGCTFASLALINKGVKKSFLKKSKRKSGV